MSNASSSCFDRIKTAITPAKTLTINKPFIFPLSSLLQSSLEFTERVCVRYTLCDCGISREATSGLVRRRVGNYSTVFSRPVCTLRPTIARSGHFEIANQRVKHHDDNVDGSLPSLQDITSLTRSAKYNPALRY
jgi:hypothetical protein